ncbi:hypothetical protein POTOM_060822 [Populus tomentosa]|uniref:Leucine-rich repeat-containing N-terminal plant-type domain-containing protein n=1 Tax=Populus tomentosa TaxID=118781 RepID=A0A8X8BVQ2_POPTO|nr:hypothetical protein POTOM_060822 [Populus tomentosa]
MASSLLCSITIRSLLVLLLHLSSLSNYLAAKHNQHGYHRHRSHNHSPTSNQRLHQAYIALQAWRRVIYSDPNNFTTNWVGPDVCSYKGIYCAPAIDDPKIRVVAGIDLNFADIAGFLPNELGLLSDLALIHLNSNRLCGIIPQTLTNPFTSIELDVSTTDLAITPQLFQKRLMRYSLINNRFTSAVPAFLGGTSASVVVIANNNFKGCLPPSIANLADTLEEFAAYQHKLDSLSGLLIGAAKLAHNLMTGIVPQGVCILPNLANFTFSYNFFCEEEGICMNLTSKGIKYDDRRNCLPEKPLQRSQKECNDTLEHPVDCFQECCVASEGGGAFGRATPFAPALVPAATPLLSPSLAPSFP